MGVDSKNADVHKEKENNEERDDEECEESTPLLIPPQPIQKKSTDSCGKAFSKSMNVLDPLEETFFCQICIENHPYSNAFTLSQCGHVFCLDCLKQYCAYETQKANVSMKCFFPIARTNKPCNVRLNEEEILSLLDENNKKKYARFKFNQSSPHARQCPYCDHSQIATPPANSNNESVAVDILETKKNPVNQHIEWIVTCDECKRTYCYYHADRHPDISCAEFKEKKSAEETVNEEKNRKLVALLTKPCPHCGNGIVKRGGCNHMKCPQCSCSFCWLCLTIIDDVPAPDHYAAWNIQGCPGRQMEGSAPPGVPYGLAYHLTGWQLRGWRLPIFILLTSLFYIWFFVVICPISLILTAIMLIVCAGCVAYSLLSSYTDLRQWRQVFCFIFQSIGAVLCLFSSCVCALPLGVVYVIFKICGLNPPRRSAREEQMQSIRQRDLDVPWRRDFFDDEEQQTHELHAEEKNDNVERNVFEQSIAL